MTPSAQVAAAGLACSCIVIVLWLIMAIVDLRNVSRVTIRLVAGIAVADFIAHITAIYGNGTEKHVGTPFCEAMAAMKTLERHLYAFTNIAICYHLYRVIVQLKKPNFKSELLIWFVSLLINGILMIIYHFIGAFSGTIGKKSCNPGADNPAITKLVFGLIGVFNLIAIVAGIYITIVGHKHLARWVESFSNKEFLDPKDQEEFKKKRISETQRSFLYPLCALFTLSGEVVLCFWMLAATPSQTMYTVSSIMQGFKGILTLLTFLLDPTVQLALKHTYGKLTGKVVDVDNIENKDI